MTPDQKLERVPGAEQPKLTGYEKRELQGHKKRVCTLAWSSSGRKLASGSTDAAIRVWSIEPHAQVGRAERSDAELKGHTSTISHVAWKPGSESVLASAGDKSIRFWDAKANKGTSVVPLNVSNSFITWSPDGNNVAAIDNDSTLSIIDVRKAKVVKTHKFKEDVWDIHWGPTIQHFMLATDKGSVDVVSMPTMEPLWSLTGHTSIALCFAITNKYKYLVSGGGDALVALWDLDDQVCVRTWAHMDNPLRAVSLSHDNQMVAYATDSGDAIPPIEIVSTRTGEKLESIKVRAQCDSLAWSPTHNVLAYCDEVLGERPRDAYQSQSVPSIGVVGIYAPPKG